MLRPRPATGRRLLEVESHGLATWNHFEAQREYRLKRGIDVLLASIGLVLTAPVFAIVAILIKLEDGGPIFYAQERVGKDFQPFWLRKFRSMIPDAEGKTGPVWSCENDPRVLRVGRILRQTALDELPQLISIFKGDLSFVGPRSHRMFFFQKFHEELSDYDRRYGVQPGLTGLAQVLGHYDSSARQKLRLDLIYIKNQSATLDLKLILASILVTILGRWDQRHGRKLAWVERFLRLGHHVRRSVVANVRVNPHERLSSPETRDHDSSDS